MEAVDLDHLLCQRVAVDVSGTDYADAIQKLIIPTRRSSRCGSMQAYALAGGDRRLKLTPRRLNTLFLGVLIVVGAIMLASDVLVPPL